MATSLNLFSGQIAASRVGSGHCFAVSHRLRRYEPSPQLRCRSLFAYLSDMWLQHNLKGNLHRNKPLCCSLRRTRDTEGRSLQPFPTLGKVGWWVGIAVSGLPTCNTNF